MTMLMHHMLRAAAGYAAPTPPSTDPQFNYVTMLLHGDGTNGAQNNTFVDSSTNNFTITRNGTPTQGSFSPYGTLWSNYFPGTTSDYLSFPSSSAFSAAGAFTWETWYYPTVWTNNGTEGTTLYKVNTTNGMQIGRQSSGSVWGIAASGVAWLLTTSTSPILNTWNHLVIVRSGTGANQTSIFLNGVRVANGTVTTSFATGALFLSFNNNIAAALGGYLSNLRFVQGTAVYDPTQTTLTVPAAPLTAVSGTSLLTCQSNRFKDNSSNNFAITVTGTPSVQRFSPFKPSTGYTTSVIGGSGYFNGTSQSLSGTSNAAFAFGTGDFTVEAWVYTTQAINAEAAVFDLGAVNSAGSFAVFRGANGAAGTWFVRMDGTGNDLSTPVSSSILNSWTHLAVCKSGSTVTFYINGVAAVSGSRPSINITQSTPYIGQLNSFGYWWGGYISNLRVIKGTAVYTTTFTPPTAPLTAITNTSMLLNTVNAGIFDNAMMNDLVTVGNAQVSTAVVKYGTGSMAFDGTGDWLTFVDSPNVQLGSGDFTIEGWVNLSLLGSARGIFSKGTSTTGLSLAVNALNQVVFNYTASSLTGTTVLMATTWYHIAVVRSGSATGNVKIFINGTADATSGGAITDNFNQTNAGYIGADRVGTSPMNGYIDDLRITKGYARYTANFTPPTAALPNN